MPTGGILTVNSEMGEPIHKIATRGVILWKELDLLIFDLPKDKQLPVLLKHKEHIIFRLDRDFQKVWFPKVKGKLCDLEDMNFSNVVFRLLELFFIKDKWIDRSYCLIVQDFLIYLFSKLIYKVDDFPVNPDETF